MPSATVWRGLGTRQIMLTFMKNSFAGQIEVGKGDWVRLDRIFINTTTLLVKRVDSKNVSN